MIHMKYSTLIVLSLIGLACHDSGTSPVRVASFDQLNGHMLNWTFGDSVRIELWVQLIDSAQTYPPALVSFGSVRADGSFQLPLSAPPNESLVLGTYNPNDTTTSDINARFCYALRMELHGRSGIYLGRAQCYSNSYFSNPQPGDYYLDLVYADRDVRVHGYIFGSSTVLADLHFSQGWNCRFFRVDSVGTNRRTEIATIDNRFVGGWNQLP
jgi:hypothetical protein